MGELIRGTIRNYQKLEAKLLLIPLFPLFSTNNRDESESLSEVLGVRKRDVSIPCITEFVRLLNGPQD